MTSECWPSTTSTTRPPRKTRRIRRCLGRVRRRERRLCLDGPDINGQAVRLRSDDGITCRRPASASSPSTPKSRWPKSSAWQRRKRGDGCRTRRRPCRSAVASRRPDCGRPHRSNAAQRSGARRRIGASRRAAAPKANPDLPAKSSSSKARPRCFAGRADISPVAQDTRRGCRRVRHDDGDQSLEQFQEKCETVFRPDCRQNKEIERFGVSMKR